MKIVFISGRYSAATYLEVDENIAECRKVAAWLAERGIGFWAPHLHSAHFEAITPDVPNTFWRELDLKFLPVCDAMYMLSGWEESMGATAERWAMLGLGKPVFQDLGPLERWAAS